MTRNVGACARILAAALAFSASLPFSAAHVHGQLFEHLQGFGTRVRVGSDGIASSWEDGKEGPKGIAAGDLDGDGKVDLAASNLDGTVTVYFNRSGELTERLDLPTGTSTLRQVIIADLTADGQPDIAACSLGDSVIVLFPGNGKGLFGQPQRLATWPYARNLAAGDFDGDQINDLAVAGSRLGLRLYHGTPEGLIPRVDIDEPFGAQDGYSKPVYSLRILRLPASSSDALVMTHAWSSQVCVLTGNPFGTSFEWNCIDGIREVYDLDVEPVLRPAADGLPDLITAHRDVATVEVRRGIAAPQFFEDAPAQKLAIPGGPRAVKALDLDQDGWNDLVVVVRNLDRVLTFRNVNGTLRAFRETPVGRSPRDLAAGDFNGDGQPDVAVINRLSEDVSVLTSFPKQVGFAGKDQVYLVDGEVCDLAVIDVNGDARSDILQLHRASGDVSVRLSGEDGRLEDPVFHDMGSVPNALRVADVTGDGRPDLVTVHLGRTGGEPGSLVIRPGDGAGGFGEARPVQPPADAGRLFALETADFDLDGDLDLAAAYLDSRLAFFHGQPGGDVQHARTMVFAHETRGLASGDFDGDGDVDLAGAAWTGDLALLENQLLENQSDFFDAAREVRRHEHPVTSKDKLGTRELKAKDLDNNGDLDLVMGTGSGAQIFLGGPGMALEPPRDTLAFSGFTATGIAIEDFNDQGGPEVAVSCRHLSCINVLTRDKPNGQLGEQFEPAVQVDVPAGLLIAAGDVDGDGRPDLVGTGEALWTALSSRRPSLSDPPLLHANRDRIVGPVINEILALNTSVPVGPEGEKWDWIEMFNGTVGPLDLSGFVLRRDSSPNDPEPETLEFRFPQMEIPSGGHFLVYATKERARPFHAGFKLPATGGVLSLLDPAGTVIDRVEFPPQQENVSFARYRDGIAAFIFNPQPSPGKTNTDNGPVNPRLRLEAVVPKSWTPDQPVTMPKPNEPIRFYAVATDDIGMVSVRVLFGEMGASTASMDWILLYDDGMHEDGKLLDGTFSGVLEQGFPFRPGGGACVAVEGEDVTGGSVAEPDDPSVGDIGDGRDLYCLAIDPDEPELEVTEMVSSNSSGLQDERLGYPDWVEVRNVTDRQVNLQGYFLGERFPANESWFRFPAQGLAPGQRTVVYCDRETEQGPFHAPFELNSAEGGQIVIARAVNFPQRAFSLVQSQHYGPLRNDRAWAKLEGRWGEAAPTPLEENPCSTAFLGDVDENGRVDVTDSVRLLGFLFLGGSVSCRNAGDLDRGGVVDISDPIHLLDCLFLKPDCELAGGVLVNCDCGG